MSTIFGRSPSRCAAGDFSSKHRHQRRHRHKRFHVRREALGQGYANYDVIAASTSEQVPAAAQQVNAITANAPVRDVAAVTSEWEKVSEKETSCRAARNGLQIWLSCITVLAMLGLMFAYRGYLWRVFDWMRQFPLPKL